MTDSEWRYTKDEPTPDEVHDLGTSDGCKDCCSLVFGAVSLTGLVAVALPMLVCKLKKSNFRLDESEDDDD